MRQILAVGALAVMAMTTGAAHGQETVAEPTGQKTLAATMKVYVFPTQGQATEQQANDEAACYSWAVENTGTDPFELGDKVEAAKRQAEQTTSQTAQATQGAGAKGAVRGAAVGALIGEIADNDAGEGAAYGAAAGMIAGRRRARAAQQQAQRQAEAQVQQAEQVTAEQLEDFKKAFSVCLEAKGYLVKY
jgi:hypothetical protein